MSPLPPSSSDQVRRLLVGLKMARALEALDDVLDLPGKSGGTFDSVG